MCKFAAFIALLCSLVAYGLARIVRSIWIEYRTRKRWERYIDEGFGAPPDDKEE